MLPRCRFPPELIKRRFPGSDQLHAEILAALPRYLIQNRGPSTLGDDTRPRRAPGLFTWELPAAREIRRRFLAVLDQGQHWSFDAWVNLNRRGDGNRMHTHGGGPGSAKFSGIYYVSDGGGTAPTVFPDAISGDRRVFPEPGLLVIFPSDVRHAVESHNGPGERVTIAVNAYPVSAVSGNLAREVSPEKTGDRRPGSRSGVVK